MQASIAVVFVSILCITQYEHVLVIDVYVLQSNTLNAYYTHKQTSIPLLNVWIIHICIVCCNKPTESIKYSKQLSEAKVHMYMNSACLACKMLGCMRWDAALGANKIHTKTLTHTSLATKSKHIRKKLKFEKKERTWLYFCLESCLRL